MTTLSIAQTYALARQAGFSATQAATATAIAMAESGLRVDNRCLNCFPGVREDSNGLWQINVDAHPQYDSTRLRTDPAYNARAAFEVSGGGKTFRPWSTYTNGAYLTKLPAVTRAIGGGDPGPLSAGGAPAAQPPVGAASSSASSSHDWKIPLPGLPDIHLDGAAIMRGGIAVGVVAGGLYLLVHGVMRTVAPTVKRTLDSGTQAAEVAAVL